MMRILSCLAILVVTVFVIASCSPRFLTRVFFGVNTGPVELPLSDSYDPREADERTLAIVAAANAFITSLDAEQQQAAKYAFSDNAQRANWSNFPEGMIPRGGLKLHRLSNEQRALLDELLAEFLSDKGVRNLEYQLAAEDVIPPSSMLKYGSQFFYVAFLGEPSNSAPWMFQFGGHHLAINVTVYGQDVTFSPMLTGGQPLHIRFDGRDVFITEEETAAAQAFMDSLTADQEAIAVRGDEPIDLLLGPGEYGTILAPEGIKGSDLTSAQKQLLLEVIRARLGLMNDDDHAAVMTTILADIDDTHFGWWGPQGRLGFAYFRVTGPSLVLEYAPQDDAGAAVTDHAHSMYRDPGNDYGSAWVGADE